MAIGFRRARAAVVLLSLFLPSAVNAAPAIPDATHFQALKYRNIGPHSGGRSIAVAGSSAQPQTFYFGATGGGVWKSEDSGRQWANVSDKYFQTGAVGALAVAPSDPNVIYAGMGESFIRGDMITGDGVYKSTDAGKTWTHVGLERTHVISQIVVDPTDPDRVYVAALGHVFGDNQERGVYRSTDGGASWKKILYKNAQSGAGDITIDPHNPRVLYAALWQASRKPWELISGGAGSGLFASSDGGDHWQDLSRNAGLPKPVLGKIGVSVSGANSNRVYAIIEASEGGVFRSDDHGETWSRVNQDAALRQRPWYYTRIYADPKNQDLVYVPQVSGLFRSADGGANFKPLKTPFADNHVLWINPENPETMIVSNDGGASVSRNAGQSWTVQNQPIGQFYHVALDNRFPYHVYGAQQDGGPVDIVSRTQGDGITAKDWSRVAGGEAGYVLPDPQDPEVTYGGSYGGYLVRFNQRTQEREIINVWPDNPMGHSAADLKYRFQWTFPLMISPHDPGVLYAAAQYVFRSTDKGHSWTQISPDLTRNDKSKQQSSGGPIAKDNTSIEYYDTVFALAESPVEKGVLWAGTDDGLVQISRDGGAHWKNVTPKGLPEWATVSIIEASRFEGGTAYLAAHRYRLDDFRPQLYKTTDYGAHWQRIASGIPNDDYTFVIREDSASANLLYAGTQRGVYVSFDRGEHWQPLQLNLPRVPIYDLAIQARENDLVVATHGRSFWILDNLEVLRQLSKDTAKAEVFLFEPEPVWLTNGESPEEPAPGLGENPPAGAAIFYGLKNAPALDEIVTLDVLSASGANIASFTNKKKPESDKEEKQLADAEKFYPTTKNPLTRVLAANAGANRFIWDLRYPDATKVPEAVIWDGSVEGPKIVPGRYSVRLTAGGQTMQRDLVVNKDPRIKTTQAELEARFDLLMNLHRKLDATHQSILRLRSARDQLDGYLKKLKQHPQIAQLKQAAQPLQDGLTEIENALIQSKSKAPQDPLNYPIRLNNKLAALAGTIEASSAKPTVQEYQVFDQLTQQTDAQLKALDELLHSQVPKFNAVVEELHIPAIYLEASAQ